VLNDTLGSDHLPVIIKLNEPAIAEEVSIPQWSYCRANWDKYKRQVDARLYGNSVFHSQN